jgi:hypothetical protein
VVTVKDAPRLENLQAHLADLSASAPGRFDASARVAGGGSVRANGSLQVTPVKATGKAALAGVPLAAVWRYLPRSSGAPPAGAIDGTFDFRYDGQRFSVSRLVARAVLRQGGSLAANGELDDLRLEAKELPIAVAQPFLPRDTPMRLGAGELSGEGRLRLGEAKRFDGTLSVRDARIEDANSQPLISWRRLGADDVRIGFSPFSLAIGEALLDAPRARVEIGPKGELNLARLAPQGAGKPGAAPTISVARIRIEGGEVAFADRSLDTPFATTVRELTGWIASLSTTSKDAARVQLAGRVGRYGEARVSGGIDLLSPESRTGVRVRFRNLALADFTPYATKFAGYRIESGRLDADLRYRVRDGRLVGDNKLVFDDLQLGEKVASASALDLPLDLAVALLTDSKGRINLAIPVSGDLRDPHFDLGGLVAKAVRNTLGNIVSAPFRLLASAFGADRESLERVSFDPGSARLSPPEEEGVAKVAQALAARPQLSLVVHPGADAASDSAALKRAAVLNELRKKAGFAAAGAGGPDPGVDLRDAKIVRAAEQLYLSRVGGVFELRGLDAKKPGYGRRLVDAIAERTPLAPQAVAGLAAARGQAVRDALVKSGVDAKRIALAPPADEKADDDGVATSLELAAR